MGTYLGFDPGGAKAFGWSVLSGEAFPLRLSGSGVADHAQGAFQAALDHAGGDVHAVGIDAPLFWNQNGDRAVDKALRKEIIRLGSSGATVNSVNSLRGACLIQGVLVAMLCQRNVPRGIGITESHPKALLWLLGKATARRAVADIRISDLGDLVQETKFRETRDHERDAVLGALAAFAMASGSSGWRNLYLDEPTPLTPLSPPPGYWMPLAAAS